LPNFFIGLAFTQIHPSLLDAFNSSVSLLLMDIEPQIVWMKAYPISKDRELDIADIIFRTDNPYICECSKVHR